MTDTQRRLPTPEDLAAWDAHDAQELREKEEIRRSNQAHTAVAVFIQSSTERISRETRGKTISRLPEVDDDILQIADAFACVADYSTPGYLEAIKVTSGEFFMLHVEIETAARAIDPNRSLYPPTDPLPQA